MSTHMSFPGRLSVAMVVAALSAQSASALPAWNPRVPVTAFETGEGVTLVADRHRPQAARRPAGGGGGQKFNSNNFRKDVSSNRVNSNRVNASKRNNVAVSNQRRNVAVNNSRNVVVAGNRGGGGGYCCNDYDSGPGWGGVAAGVVAGAAVGAIVTSAATSSYAPPPAYVPPGYVAVPAY